MLNYIKRKLSIKIFLIDDNSIHIDNSKYVS